MGELVVCQFCGTDGPYTPSSPLTTLDPMRLLLAGVMCLVLARCAAAQPTSQTINPYVGGWLESWSGPVAWMLDAAAPTSAESQVLNLILAVPACGGHGKLTPVVEYRPSEVAVELRLDDVPNCLQAGGPVRYALQMEEPLGQRDVVDLVPTAAWPYRSLEEWGRLVTWDEAHE